MSTTAEMLADWLNGTPTGGPNADGRYPLVYQDGNTYLVYCPAAQALNPSVVEQPIETFSANASNAAANALTDANDAASSALQAQNSATAAATSATTANTKAIAANVAAAAADAQANAAADSATAAATSETNAATSASDAATSATNAATSATNADASATAASTSASAAAGSATNASTAQTAAEAARDLAQAWSSQGVDIVVSGGQYSAYHWAQKAQAAATGVLKYKGTWDATTAYPSGAVTGDFWKVSVAGSGYDIGDQILYNGTSWDKIDNTELVTSVAGRIGAITLVAADIGGLGALATLATADWATKVSGKPTTFAGYGVPILAADVPALPTSKITGLDTTLAAKANDADVIHKTGDETKSGRLVASLSHADGGGYFNIGAYSSTYGSGYCRIYWDNNGLTLKLVDANSLVLSGASGGTVWHSGNFTPTTKLDKVTSSVAAAANSIVDNGYFQALDDPNLPTTGWYWIHSFRHTNAGYGWQFMNHHGTEDWYVRRQVAGTWQPAVELWHSANFDPATYAPLADPAFTGVVKTGGAYGPQIGMLAGSASYGYLWPAGVTPGTLNYSIAINVAGTYTYINATTLTRLAVGGTPQMDIGSNTVTRKNANSTTMTAQPRIFVQSADPGAAAADGDLWFW